MGGSRREWLEPRCGSGAAKPTESTRGSAILNPMEPHFQTRQLLLTMANPARLEARLLLSASHTTSHSSLNMFEVSDKSFRRGPRSLTSIDCVDLSMSLT